MLSRKLLCAGGSCTEQDVVCRSDAVCVIPAFMQPQVKMLSRPEESKGLFISTVDKKSLLLPPKAAENASQRLT